MQGNSSAGSVKTSNPRVCACLNVTHAELQAAIGRDDVRTLEDLCRYTGAGAGCMACHPRLRRYVSAAAQANPREVCAAGSGAR